MIPGVTASPRTKHFPLASNPAVFIAVGTKYSGPALITTEDVDATNWVDRSGQAASASANAWLYDVCYSLSLNRWVAVGFDQNDLSTPVVIYSDDGGSTWNAATADPSSDFVIRGVCWTGSTFIAVGHSSDQSTPIIMTSTTGTAWTQKTSDPASNNMWMRVFGISGLAVAVGGVDEFGSPAHMASSTDDGGSWTSRTPPLGGFVECIVLVSGGTHVCAGFNIDGSNIGTSTNGTSWTVRSSPTDQSYYGVAWNGSIYVAVGMDFNTTLEGRAASSTAPTTTWTARATDPVSAPGSNGPNFLDVDCLNGGGFVAVGRDNNTWTIPYIMYAADGISWIARIPPFSAGSGILLGVGSTG